MEMNAFRIDSSSTDVQRSKTKKTSCETSNRLTPRRFLMFTQDPRLTFAQTQFGGYPYSPIYSAPYSPLGLYGQPQTPAMPFAYGVPPITQTLANTSGVNQIPEMTYLAARIEELRNQLSCLSNMFQADLFRRSATEAYAPGYSQTINQTQSGFPFQHPMGYMSAASILPVKLRESDSHIYCDIYLPQLAIGDVEVEVSGNRIICRTRVPVAAFGRFLSATQLPRGLEVFELPDGRVEFNWLAHVSIIAKDVEATFREGFLCICIPKTEITAQRHTVKISKETASSRRAEMNS